MSEQLHLYSPKTSLTSDDLSTLKPGPQVAHLGNMSIYPNFLQRDFTSGTKRGISRINRTKTSTFKRCIMGSWSWNFIKTGISSCFPLGYAKDRINLLIINIDSSFVCPLQLIGMEKQSLRSCSRLLNITFLIF